MIALLIGADIPEALIRTAGLRPERVRLADIEDRTDWAGVSCVVLSHLTADNARNYQRLHAHRPPNAPPVIFLDLPAQDSPATRTYAARRLRELSRRLTVLTGQSLSDSALHEQLELHSDPGPAPIDAPSSLWATGRRVVVVGGARLHDEAALRSEGYLPVVYEGEQGYGRTTEAIGPSDDPWTHLVDQHFLRARATSRASLHARSQALRDLVTEHRAEGIVIVGPLTDTTAWLRAILESSGPTHSTHQRVWVTGAEEHGAATTAAPPSATQKGTARLVPTRSRKALTVTDSFGAYQRNWFAGIREQVAAGSPFAVVNADAPQEILRALGIPFVINQWWASIVAAKQATPRYLAALADQGLPTRHETYNSQGIADLFVDENQAPWGGLPTPNILCAVRGEDAITGIFEEWAARSGANLLMFDRTVESREYFPVDWWEVMPHHWNTALESDRLDSFTQQLRDTTARLEQLTGRTLDADRLDEVLDLVNEQEEYYRRTRDLIAATHPAPVSIVDTMPATMIPQWHRGTEWARDAAKAFHEEVQARVAEGASVVPDERLRLMWVGRGAWQNMALYQAFEQTHGAVFVWSMYLGLAADGYLRYLDDNQDPLRSVAARFITMGDELRSPSWAAAWHVAEAQRHGVHAAIAIADAEPSVCDALEAAGVPVLRLTTDNLSPAGLHAATQTIGTFLDRLPDPVSPTPFGAASPTDDEDEK